VRDAWVVNASPLIILSRIGRLDFLEHLAPALTIPDAVILEVGAGLNHDPSATTTLQWAKERTVPNKPLPTTWLTDKTRQGIDFILN
jgi:predicted nucleic acid-binding protein